MFVEWRIAQSILSDTERDWPNCANSAYIAQCMVDVRNAAAAG